MTDVGRNETLESKGSVPSVSEIDPSYTTSVVICVNHHCLSEQSQTSSEVCGTNPPADWNPHRFDNLFATLMGNWWSKLCRLLATHGCESWTLKKNEEDIIQAFENKCVRKLMRISWTKMITTGQIYQLARRRISELLNHIKSRKLRGPICWTPRKTEDVGLHWLTGSQPSQNDNGGMTWHGMTW